MHPSRTMGSDSMCFVSSAHVCSIVIALDEMHSSAVLSFIVFFSEVAVGVGGSVERDQSAPAQTAPQQARFGSD